MRFYHVRLRTCAQYASMNGFNYVFWALRTYTFVQKTHHWKTAFTSSIVLRILSNLHLKVYYIQSFQYPLKPDCNILRVAGRSYIVVSLYLSWGRDVLILWRAAVFENAFLNWFLICTSLYVSEAEGSILIPRIFRMSLISIDWSFSLKL